MLLVCFVLFSPSPLPLTSMKIKELNEGREELMQHEVMIKIIEIQLSPNIPQRKFGLSFTETAVTHSIVLGRKQNRTYSIQPCIRRQFLLFEQFRIFKDFNIYFPTTILNVKLK